MNARDYVRANREELDKLETNIERAQVLVKAGICSERRAMSILSQEIKSGRWNTEAVLPQTTPKPELSRADLLERYDIITKTRSAMELGLATLTNDDEIIPSSRFCYDRCRGSSAAAFKQVATEPEFRNHQFRVGDCVYWCTAATKVWALQNISRARDI